VKDSENTLELLVCVGERGRGEVVWSWCSQTWLPPSLIAGGSEQLACFNGARKPNPVLRGGDGARRGRAFGCAIDLDYPNLHTYTQSRLSY
jgi:hypothetical protein